MNVLVAGMVAAVPGHGGATWAVLQYALGLQRLGHDVFVVETCDGEPPREAIDYFRAVAAEHELTDRSAFIAGDRVSRSGVSYDDAVAFARRAEILLNLSGTLRDDRLLDLVPARVYVDIDPAFTQLWHGLDSIDMGFGAHSHFVTVGANIGSSSPIPTHGEEWITSRPPVVLEWWPPARTVRHDAFTTVANWRGYGSVEHEGVFHGQKAHSFRQFLELPNHVDAQFVLALDIHPGEHADVDALADSGWCRVDPARVAATPATYRTFVRGSKAEFSVAKSGYVVSRSGWFSDRSVCYLAAGRPVVVQDTGWTEHLPDGDGLLAFRTLDEAVDAVGAVEDNYEHHSRAARGLAEEYFDSDVVLQALLERL